jgi:DNA phosphorothioation-associated putative methyltransferase
MWREHEHQELEPMAKARSEDLLVYMALTLLSGMRRSPFGEGVKREIRAFFPSIKAAEQAASVLLFSAGKPSEILRACREAHEAGSGYLDGEHSLSIHSSLVERLPAVLRVYAGCAARLIGDISIADVVKFHIQSGKFTLLILDDFFGKPLPELRTRVKINLRSFDIDFFEYSEERPRPLLYLKSRFMNHDLEGYDQQLVFDRKLDTLGYFDLTGYGPDAEEFRKILGHHHMFIRGFQLCRRRT